MPAHPSATQMPLSNFHAVFRRESDNQRLRCSIKKERSLRALQYVRNTDIKSRGFQFGIYAALWAAFANDQPWHTRRPARVATRCVCLLPALRPMIHVRLADPVTLGQYGPALITQHQRHRYRHYGPVIGVCPHQSEISRRATRASNDNYGSRLCENAKLAKFRGWFHHSIEQENRLWSDSEGRMSKTLTLF